MYPHRSMWQTKGLTNSSPFHPHLSNESMSAKSSDVPAPPLPPPYLIQDWRRFARGPFQTIPYWRRVQRSSLNWRRVHVYCGPLPVLSAGLPLALPPMLTQFDPRSPNMTPRFWGCFAKYQEPNTKRPLLASFFCQRSFTARLIRSGANPKFYHLFAVLSSKIAENPCALSLAGFHRRRK
jgi:hypothetical protein